MNIGIIPARMASSSFPGKPLEKICSIPMIGHVYFRSKMCKNLDDVYIATCDREIVDYAQSIGAKAIMTSDKHQRASDRTAEAMLKIEKLARKRTKIVVMIQGDEPMITPDMIDTAINSIARDNKVFVSNLMAALKNKEEQADPHEIKVVVDLNGFALYFSREPIPSCKKADKEVPVYNQVCIIPFKRDFLIKFNQIKPTPLEIAESIDMLRVLEHGYKVKMVLSKKSTYSVDTPADIKKVNLLMQSDKLINKYK